MGHNINNRLTKLESVTRPDDPPTIQVIFHRWDGVEYGPIQPAPQGRWNGLQQIIVEYTQQWRGNDETEL